MPIRDLRIKKNKYFYSSYTDENGEIKSLPPSPHHSPRYVQEMVIDRLCISNSFLPLYESGILTEPIAENPQVGTSLSAK